MKTLKMNPSALAYEMKHDTVVKVCVCIWGSRCRRCEFSCALLTLRLHI